MNHKWQARGIAFVTLGEGIDTSTAAGRLVAGVLGSIAEFERSRIQERIYAGLARARSQGKRLGRRRSSAARRLDDCAGISHAAAAAHLGVSVASVKRWRRADRPAEDRPSAARCFRETIRRVFSTSDRTPATSVHSFLFAAINQAVIQGPSGNDPERCLQSLVEQKTSDPYTSVTTANRRRSPAPSPAASRARAVPSTPR